MYQEPPESLEQQSDQAILPNLNSQWVNAKGECGRNRCCKGHVLGQLRADRSGMKDVDCG